MRFRCVGCGIRNSVRWMFALISCVLLQLSAVRACHALAPRYITDAQIADMPLIVVAHWDRAKRVPHVHERVEPSMGKVIDKWEVRTELVIDRVIKGEIVTGRHKLLCTFGIAWGKDGKGLESGTSTELMGDVDDVTKPALWFLSHSRSWDTADKTDYLNPMTYRCVQPLNLEPYYKVLTQPDRDLAFAQLLTSKDEEVVRHCLLYVNIERYPWPYNSKFEDFIRQPNAKEKPLIQHAQRISDLLHTFARPLRPLAVAIYAELAGEKSVEQMRLLIKDRDPKVRAISVGVLTRYRDLAKITGFQAALTGLKDAQLGCEVIKRLEAWGDIRLVPSLISFLQDDSSAGFIGDDYLVPALKAKRALHSMTGYWFPCDVHKSLGAWNAITKQTSRPELRGKLVHILGDDACPLHATVVGPSRAAVVVTNTSTSPIVIEKIPDYVDYNTFMNNSHSPIYVTLRPGKRVRVALRVEKEFILADPAHRKVELAYLHNGNDAGKKAWMGTLFAYTGTGWKEPKRLRKYIVNRWPNGTIREKGWTLNNYRDGVWIFYRQNGKKTEEREYSLGNYSSSTIYSD